MVVDVATVREALVELAERARTCDARAVLGRTLLDYGQALPEGAFAWRPILAPRCDWGSA